MDDDRSANLQPTLNGDAILIRPLRADDWTDMFRAASDPLIWELHPARERYREPVFRGYFDGAMASKCAFAFIERATGEIVGVAKSKSAGRFWFESAGADTRTAKSRR